MQRPLDTIIQFDDSRPSSPTSSSEFEKVEYPPHPNQDSWRQQQQAELPLHYMNSEDTAARRRVTRAPGAHADDDGQWRAQDDDDSGKGFHAKPGLHPPRFIGGGRLPSRGPPPPAQNLVRVITMLNYILYILIYML